MDVRPLTVRAMETIKRSLDIAAAHKHDHVGIEHLLLALTDPDSKAAVTRHADLMDACTRIHQLVKRQIEPGTGDGSKSVPQTPMAQRLLMNSMRIAESLHHASVNPEHMLLAFLDLESEMLVEGIVDDKEIDTRTMRIHLVAASALDK